MTIKITKQLATMEDLAIGTGTVVQKRNGVPLTLNKINFITPSILASEDAGEGAALVSMENGPTVEVAVLDRVIRVTSIAAMEAYSAPVGDVFSLNAGGRSGTFDVVAGDFSTELAADTLNGFYIGLDDDPTATTKVAKRRSSGEVFVSWFGAVGDGVTNDTDAMRACTSYVDSTEGAHTIVFEDRTYIVGKQAAGGALYLQGGDVVGIYATKNLTILGNGALLKIEDGLKYGSFDPATGYPYYPTMPFTDFSYAAVVGFAISINNCDSLRIENINVDGNASNLEVGGQWGDVGIQLRAVGIEIIDCSKVSLLNCTSSHNGLDGCYLKGANADEFYSTVDGFELTNCTFSYNGRQALSVVGGTGFTFTNCEFSETQQGPISSAPGSGCDLEPNGAYWAKDIVFNGCLFSNNGGPSIVADGTNVKGVLVNACTFWAGFSGSSDAIWLQVEGVTIANSFIHGCITNLIGSAVVKNTVLDSKRHPTYGMSSSNRSYILQNASSTFINCDFVVRGPGRLVIAESGAIFDSCTFTYSPESGSERPNKDFIYLAEGGLLRDCKFLEGTIAVPPALGWYIDAGSKIEGNLYVQEGGYTRWGSWSPSGDNRQGLIPATAIKLLSLDLFDGKKDTGSRNIAFDSVVPTSGDRVKGDIIYNANPAVGAPKGWICTVSGTPGTWVSTGNL